MKLLIDRCKKDLKNDELLLILLVLDRGNEILIKFEYINKMYTAVLILGSWLEGAKYAERQTRGGILKLHFTGAKAKKYTRYIDMNRF